MPKTTIAAVVITKNEETRVRACLGSLKSWVDELIVVDDMSTDLTASIAEQEFGARVIRHPLEDDFAAQRNRGLDAARSEWVLEMDADEVVPPESAARMRSALELAGPVNGFQIRRINCVFDQPLKYPGRSDSVRIVRRGKGRSRGKVHETLDIEGEVGTIDAYVYHYNLPSLRHVIERNNHYTEAESEKYLQQHATLEYKVIRNKIVCGTPKQFYKHFVKHGGYKDGPYGLIRSSMHTIHFLLYWLKVLERALKEKKLKGYKP